MSRLVVLLVGTVLAVAACTAEAPEPTASTSSGPDVTGLEPANWRWTSDQPPEATATELRVSVFWQGCHGFAEPERTVPVVHYTPTEIQLVVWTEPLPDGAYACPGTPGTAIVVPLDGPLGDRQVSGNYIPPAETRATVVRVIDAYDLYTHLIEPNRRAAPGPSAGDRVRMASSPTTPWHAGEA